MGLLSLVFRFACLKRILSGLRNLQMLGSVSERNDSCLLHESVVLCKYKNWNRIEWLFCALAAYRFRWVHFSWSCRQLTHRILQLFWLKKLLIMPSKIFHNHPFRFWLLFIYKLWVLFAIKHYDNKNYDGGGGGGGWGWLLSHCMKNLQLPNCSQNMGTLQKGISLA